MPGRLSRLTSLNTRLRNEQVDLDELVRRHGIERAALEDHLAAHGFVYLPGLRQFRTPG